MPKRHPSPQEIDLRAGAISAQEYKAMRGVRLRKQIRKYRGIRNFSIAVAIGGVVLFVILLFMEWGRSNVFTFEWRILRTLTACGAAMINVFYISRKLRVAKDALAIWEDNQRRKQES